jgi:hypothetical protein
LDFLFSKTLDVCLFQFVLPPLKIYFKFPATFCRNFSLDVSTLEGKFVKIRFSHGHPTWICISINAGIQFEQKNLWLESPSCLLFFFQNGQIGVNGQHVQKLVEGVNRYGSGHVKYHLWKYPFRKNLRFAQETQLRREHVTKIHVLVICFILITNITVSFSTILLLFFFWNLNEWLIKLFSIPKKLLLKRDTKNLLPNLRTIDKV